MKQLVLLMFAAAVTAQAEVKLPSLFCDHSVLQCDQPVPVWGWAAPGEEVSVEFAGQKKTAKADDAGKWRVTLDPMKVSAEPRDMIVNKITIKDVLVGEVWICTGQSNMAFTGAKITDVEKESAAAKWPKIRLFNVKRVTSESPRQNVPGAWTECTPETMKEFSAVGYFYGRELHQKLGIPIGLIHASWSGTRAEAWVRRESLETDPRLKRIVKNWDEREAKGAGKRLAASPQQPANLYNGMVAPLIPYAIRGVICYHGGASVGRAEEYVPLFSTWIRDWRQQWGQGEFPFLYAQLANREARVDYPTDSAIARVREAQLKISSLPNTGIAVTIDLGNVDRHPKDKLDVGRRLALLALHHVYGKTEVVPSGPIFDQMKIEGDKLRLSFKHLGGGLVNKAEGNVRGFAIAGADKKYVWADAKIDGETVVVSSEKVKQPMAVRYGWADNPEVSLYNKGGLPASPFRTDDLPFKGAKPRPDVENGTETAD